MQSMQCRCFHCLPAAKFYNFVSLLILFFIKFFFFFQAEDGIRDVAVTGVQTCALPISLKVPVIVTTTSEKMWGPLIPELADVLHGVPSIERATVNAWDDKRVVDAVKATGRKKLIVTGISTDVCLAFPAIAALEIGRAHV